MARQKKTANGYYRKTFMYEGKRYCVYAKEQKELASKVSEKLKELEEGKKNHENPTLRDYYDYFTEMRVNEKKQTTLNWQRFGFNAIANIEMKSGKALGDMRVKSITRRDIETARQCLLEQGKKPSTVNTYFMHLNTVFENAVIDETIYKNPCKGLKKVKEHSSMESDEIHRALTEEETRRFFEYAEAYGSIYQQLYKFMLLTGMRVGEVGALHQTDIDSEFIHVRRTLTKDRSGAFIIGEDTKTKSGQRVIPINTDIAKALKGQNELNRMLYGFKWSGTVFKSVSGKILNEAHVNRDIEKICESAQIKRFTCHSFRVTFATRFIEQRPQDFKILSEIMGHKNIAITLDLYTKVMTKSKVTAMNDIKILA